ncbi:MAG: hypothetical protein JNM98_17750 [Rhodocyclaceae bacterium]|nr:hypothetical protein [Rhodocyclaceae bacterium]
MSKDDSGLEKRRKNTEFSQVSPSNTAAPRRRNSMPLPSAHGGSVSPMVRPYQPPQQQGQEYWYHVTTPENFQRIQASGGLMPHNLQPQKGVGLDEATGRGLQPPWREQVRDESRNLALTQQLAVLETPETARMLVQRAQSDLRQLAHQGTNQENLYMSSQLSSTQDYLASGPFMQEGAHIMRVPRRGTTGFVQDTQGKNADFRSLGTVISSRHMEHAYLSPEQVKNLYDKEGRAFSRELKWEPMRQTKAQPVPFEWHSGSCSTEARMQHGKGPDQDGFGGSGRKVK